MCVDREREKESFIGTAVAKNRDNVEIKVTASALLYLIPKGKNDVQVVVKYGKENNARAFPEHCEHFGIL